jgi:hypothetical protein
MPKITENYIGTKDTEKLKTNEYYLQYWLLKEEIKSKYPPIKDMDRETFKSWIKDLNDLIYTMNGPFDKFLEDTLSEQAKIEMERKVYRKKRGPRGSYKKDEDE